jgi:hypothetical protein
MHCPGLVQRSFGQGQPNGGKASPDSEATVIVTRDAVILRDTQQQDRAKTIHEFARLYDVPAQGIGIEWLQKVLDDGSTTED